MNIKKRVHFLAFFMICSLLFSGCSKVDQLKIKLGMKNNDFQYIKQGKIKKIIIQSTRDKGFRFVVKDEIAIADLYDILSSAKEVDTKSSLAPDYVFEMYESADKVHKFQYIAGLDRKDGANLYGEGKKYIVSKRIDNDIIRNFWNIRRPIKFEEVYYEAILKVLHHFNQGENKKQTIGINVKEDIEVSKFILSTDIERFKRTLQQPNVGFIEEEDKKYDIIMHVKTEGYTSSVYKSIVSFERQGNVKDKKYYVVGKYDNGQWSIQVIADEKPREF